MESALIDIFQKSQFCSSSEVALTKIKKLYKKADFNQFESTFKTLFKKFLQSKEQTNYFKTTCEFICKFLQQNQLDPNSENNPNLNNVNNRTTTNRTAQRTKAPTRRQKDIDSDEEDEIVSFHHVSHNNTTADNNDEPITDHDRLISSCIEVADLFMQAASETYRLNAVYFVCKFMTNCKSIDEEIFKAIHQRLTERIRDKKPKIRAQAVLACNTLQESKMVQDAFLYHFYRDPEIVVRKALLQVMDTKIFGYGFLADSTQDSHEVMRTVAYQKLAKVSPNELNSQQLHKILHNGLNERERRPNYAFKTNTLESWLTKLYDGLDLKKMMDLFDCIEYHDDICKFLNIVYERDLEKIENNGVVTKLHHLVETFRQQNFNDYTIPINMNLVDEKMISIWFTLVKFCKTNQSSIKPIKVRTLVVQPENDSIEKILDSNENRDELVELYERLIPDLVNLIDFLKTFTEHCHDTIESTAKNKKENVINKYRFIYKEMMEFVLTYEVGDEVERKTVQEVLGCMLKDNLLTGYLDNYISLMIKCLNKLIYSSNSNQMINYISELINNVRSHLEDIVATNKPEENIPSRLSTIPAPASKKRSTPQQVPKSAKKVRLALNEDDLETEIAKRRVDLEELNDQMEACIKDKDFDEAKAINGRITELKSELTNLHTRRFSIASDISHMSMVIDDEPCIGDGKLSSTVIADGSFSENDNSLSNGEEVKIFKNHTNELLKCLQMYFACLQNVSLKEVPQTMLNHLNLLSYECLDEWFNDNTQVRSLMVLCNGITALTDQNFAKIPTTMTLFVAACFDPRSIEIKTAGFTSLVDIIVQHKDLDYPEDKIEKFLTLTLREYGKYNPETSAKSELDFANAIIEGTSKLYYYKKLSSPAVFSHFILWWYHPKTESNLRQFIGVFLPMFVKHLSRKQVSTIGDENCSQMWLKELLMGTFITSIEYLHKYIAGPGSDMMEASDMLSLINFLCNLIPVSLHANIQVKVTERMEDLNQGKNADLLKYLKQARNSLTPITQAETNETCNNEVNEEIGVAEEDQS